jgi:hypothetical protein
MALATASPDVSEVRPACHTCVVAKLSVELSRPAPHSPTLLFAEPGRRNRYHLACRTKPGAPQQQQCGQHKIRSILGMAAADGPSPASSER